MMIIVIYACNELSKEKKKKIALVLMIFFSFLDASRCLFGMSNLVIMIFFNEDEDDALPC